jgi:hypothetical protein
MPTLPVPGFSITPHTRNAITLRIAKKKIWKGTRQGIRMEIQHSDGRHPIKWKALIHDGWVIGDTSTVWQAVVEIEQQVRAYARAHAELYGHPKE